MLERECFLLEDLHYRLVSLECLVTAGQTSLLGRAVDEVDQSLLEVRRHELVRALELARVAERNDIPTDATLQDLLAIVPPPLRRRLELLGRRLGRLNDEVDARSEVVRNEAARQLQHAAVGNLATASVA